jgi:nucleotide-binding universal stress UspA family protein
MVFKRILVPFDGSPLSEKALEQAVELAMIAQSQIYILQVIDEIPLPYSRFSKIEIKDHKVVISLHAKKIYDEIKSEISPILEDKKKHYSNDKISIITEIRIGDPIQMIVDFTKEKDIDLIVMGTVGFTGITGMIKRLGSVSRGVLEEVSCTVMLIR